MRAMMKRAKEWLGWRKEMVIAPDVQAVFFLFLGDLLVGKLSVVDGRWQFEYSEEFKLRDDLRPLAEFPDIHKVYENQELWQFFASRIPSMEQPDVEVVLANEKIAEDDVVALLKRFGKRTITNPFELKYDSVIG